MNTRRIPRELALDLCNRSPCRIKVAAVLSDNHGIFAWGWNYPPRTTVTTIKGTSMHAEQLAFRRANPRRLCGATLTVAGLKRGTLPVYARPCMETCFPLAKKHGIKTIEFLNKNGE